MSSLEILADRILPELIRSRRIPRASSRQRSLGKCKPVRAANEVAQLIQQFIRNVRGHSLALMSISWRRRIPFREGPPPLWSFLDPNAPGHR